MVDLTEESIVGLSGTDCNQDTCVSGDEDVEETIILEDYDEEPVPSKFSPFDVLPEEILTLIFSYLTLQQLCRYVAPVCQTWWSHCRNPILWQELRIDDISHLDAEELALLITKNCPILKKLSLRCRSELSEYDFRQIFRRCPVLEALSLGFCTQLNKCMLKVVAHFCPNLQELNLEGCENISDDFIHLLQSLPLKKLNVSHCTHIGNEGLVFVSKNFSSLEDINFDGIQWITATTVATMMDHFRCRLRKLWLDGENLTDDSLGLIAQCTELRTLGLSFCDSLTDASLGWIQGMHKLISLQLKKGSEFSGEGLRQLFIGLHPKTTGNQTGLVHLSVAECSGMDDLALQALADSCPNLVILNMSWCWDITDVGLLHIVTKCHNIVDLNLCGMKSILGLPLKELPNEMPKLKHLDVRQCNGVSDKLLEDLVRKMKKLKVLNYYGELVVCRSEQSHSAQGHWCDFDKMFDYTRRYGWQ